MSKPYDATREFKPFDRSEEAPKRHPNKGRSKVNPYSKKNKEA